MDFWVSLINNTPKIHHDNVHEKRLKEAVNQPNGRVVKRGKNLVPLDEDAATLLCRMKVPMAETQRTISIKNVIAE